MRLANNPSAKNDRRKVALTNLQAKRKELGHVALDLKDKGIAPIDRELAALESRIVPVQVARASRSKINRGPK